MTINETKNWLNRARVLARDIARKRERVAALRDMATSITAETSDMPRSDSPNLQRMESVMCKAMDLEKEILADEQSLVDVRAEIANAIALLEDPLEIAALNARYISCMRIADVAEELMVTDRHALRLLHSSTVNLARILTKTMAG